MALFQLHVSCNLELHVENEEKSTYGKFCGLFETLPYHIVAYLLKARTVEPEKQPLLANGSETKFVSRQRPRNRQRNGIRF
jgi:hypothetical protein